ncbi:MAG: hypothetical protein M3237_15225 [Actinomycetota bacterium]|nr:hypothetical protein [Actinomycetota bacterium]
MSTGSLRVQRHVVTCRSFGASPGSGVMDAFAEGFAERLGDAMDTLGGPSGYWVVRRLDVSSAVATSWGPGQVATAVANSVAAGLVRTVDRGTKFGSVLWFPDRAAFLGRFVVDAAERDVSDRWEYARFAGVLGRPGRLLVELARTDAADLLAGLTDLGSAELERVVAAADPGSVVDLLRILSGGGFDEGRPALVLGATRELMHTGRLTGGPQAALLIALTAARAHGADALAALAGPALDVAGVLGMIDGLGPRARGVVAALAAARWAEALAEVGADEVLPLVQWPDHDRRELCRLLVPDPAPAEAGPDVEWTAFGGMFLLIPLLGELWDWPTATAGWPACGGVPAERVAKLLVLTAALGRGRTSAPVTDPVLRLALGIPAELSSADVESWLADLVPEHAFEVDGPEDDCLRLAPPLSSYAAAGLFTRLAGVVVRDLGAHLPGMAAASPSYLWANVLDFEAEVRIAPASVVVELGDPPLHVLLSLTGMNRGHFACEDGERAWILTSR